MKKLLAIFLAAAIVLTSVVSVDTVSKAATKEDVKFMMVFFSENPTAETYTNSIRGVVSANTGTIKVYNETTKTDLGTVEVNNGEFAWSTNGYLASGDYDITLTYLENESYNSATYKTVLRHNCCAMITHGNDISVKVGDNANITGKVSYSMKRVSVNLANKTFNVFAENESGEKTKLGTVISNSEGNFSLDYKADLPLGKYKITFDRAHDTYEYDLMIGDYYMTVMPFANLGNVIGQHVILDGHEVFLSNDGKVSQKNATSKSDVKIDKTINTTKITSIKNKKKKKVVLKWNKIKYATQYQVRYSKKKTMVNGQYVITSKNKITIKKLKKKKTYYFQVCGIRGKAIGDWSKIKKIKIKK